MEVQHCSPCTFLGPLVIITRAHHEVVSTLFARNRFRRGSREGSASGGVTVATSSLTRTSLALLIHCRVPILLIISLLIRLQRRAFWFARFHKAGGETYVIPHYSIGWAIMIICMYTGKCATDGGQAEHASDD